MSSQGSLYKDKKKDLWVGKVYVDTPEGLRKRVTVYGSVGGTKDEVRKKIAELVSESEKGVSFVGDKQTLAQFVDYWLDAEVKPNRKLNTYSVYRDSLDRYILPKIGAYPIKRITYQAVDTVFKGLPAHLSSSTRKVVFSVLRRVFRRAVQLRVIPHSPMEGMIAPTVTRKDFQVWTVEEVKKFLSATKGDWMWPLWSFALNMGMRQGEMLALYWEDVDLKAGTVNVRKTLVEKRGKVIGRFDPKTRTSLRKISLTPPAKEALVVQQKALMARGLRASSWVFPNWSGAPHQKSGLRDIFDRSIEKAGVPRIRFHDMRHTHATIAIAAGCKPKTLQGRLGHASITMTFDTYTRFMESEDKEVAEKIGELLK